MQTADTKKHKERPILFSAPMVRAILSGAKTQTRRPLKMQPPPGAFVDDRPGVIGGFYLSQDANGDPIPYGLRVSWSARPPAMPGDRLWVREAWQCFVPGAGKVLPLKPRERPAVCSLGFLATEAQRVAEYSGDVFAGPWRPSIHMPRWASRITLDVLDVRVERLQDISEEDARAEGVAPAWLDVNGKDVNAYAKPTYRQGFVRTWRDLYGDEATDANPFVWVVSFRRCVNAVA